MENRFSNAVVASLDVLGSSDIISHDGEAETFIDSLYGLHESISGDSIGEFNLKTFSDNALLYSSDTSASAISRFISALAALQFNVMCYHNLLLRGGLVVDKFYSSEADSGKDFVIGRSLVRVHELESKHAVYPRIVVGDEILEILKTNGSEDAMIIKNKNDVGFIDYLQSTIDPDGFPDSESLRRHANALVKHIKHDNDRRKQYSSNIKDWDSIRSKDVWAIAYHNDFCRRNNIEDCRIDFTEEYSADGVMIRINEEMTGEVDGSE